MVFTNEWKKARVTPIYKSEDKIITNNILIYNILPIICKFFEKEVFRQMYSYLTDNALLSKYQFGFRPKHSTLSALTVEPVLRGPLGDFASDRPIQVDRLIQVL